MVGVFFRLKLTVMRNTFSVSKTVGQAAFIVVWMIAIGGGMLAAVPIAAALRGAPEQASTVAAVVFSFFALMWIVLPVIAASFDQTLQPRSFELFPLTWSALASGLAAAALVSPGVVFTAISLGGGLAFGVGGGPAPVAIGLVALGVFVAMVIALSRLVTTVLSDLLRRRRTRDVITMVMLVLLVLPSLLSVAFAEGVDFSRVDTLLRSIGRVVEWNPAGMTGRAAVAARDGSVLEASGLLLVGMATVIGLVVLWALALRRLQTRSATDPVRAVAGGTALRVRFVPLPSGPIGAVGAKELHYLRRDIRVRAQMFGSGIVFVGLVAAAWQGAISHPLSPYLAALAGFMIVAPLTFNGLGFDGGSMWGYAVSGATGKVILAGKNVAALIAVSTVTIVTASLLAWFSGSWVHLIGAILASLGLAMVWIGIGDVLAVYGAYPMPEDNMFASRSGSWQAALLALAGMAVGAIAIAIPALGFLTAWGRFGTAGALAGSAVVFGYGAGWSALGLWLGGRAFDEQLTRLVAVLDEA
ncbi:MAG: hypothetical protein OEO77_15685 [Acidimicrobiia bacterium]|nr:hypothetical protein [Acidimicrobiia bacterium]